VISLSVLRTQYSVLNCRRCPQTMGNVPIAKILVDAKCFIPPPFGNRSLMRVGRERGR